MESCKSIQSEKGNTKLVDKENYVYQNHKENADASKIYWSCEKRIIHIVQNYDQAERMQFLKVIAHNIKV